MTEIEQEVVVAEVETDEVTPETELTETTDWQAEAKKARGIAQRLRTKLAKATEKKVVVETPTKPVVQAQNPSRLDETQLDYLDLKGVSDSDDIDVVQKVMLKTGLSVRDVLKDDYVQTKLKANKEAREVKAAMPTATKRTGSGADNSLEIALAKYEQSGFKELPTDTTLRRQVVNAARQKTDTNKPAWA